MTKIRLYLDEDTMDNDLLDALRLQKNAASNLVVDAIASSPQSRRHHLIMLQSFILHR
jgi:hypothetical protein